MIHQPFDVGHLLWLLPIILYTNAPRTWIPGEMVTSNMMNSLRDLFLEIEAGTAEMLKVLLGGRTSAALAGDLSASGKAKLAYNSTLKKLMFSWNAGAYFPLEIYGTVTLTDGATPALDASLGSIFDLVAAGDRVIGIPTNPTDGQKIIIRHTASAANRTLGLNTGAGGFHFTATVPALTPTLSGKIDYIGALYNGAATRWDVLGYAKGA